MESETTRDGDVASGRRPMGALEAEVLEQLWLKPGGATPRQVLEGLDFDVVYTTVMNVLVRLWRKGLVSRERRGKAYVYRARVDEAELAARRMLALLDRASDRTAALLRFVGDLPDGDAHAVRTILAQLDADG